MENFYCKMAKTLFGPNFSSFVENFDEFFDQTSNLEKEILKAKESRSEFFFWTPYTRIVIDFDVNEELYHFKFKFILNDGHDSLDKIGVVLKDDSDGLKSVCLSIINPIAGDHQDEYMKNVIFSNLKNNFIDIFLYPKKPKVKGVTIPKKHDFFNFKEILNKPKNKFFKQHFDYLLDAFNLKLKFLIKEGYIPND